MRACKQAGTSGAAELTQNASASGGFGGNRKRKPGHRADRTTGLAIAAQGLVQDRLDVTSAPSALWAATQAAIDLAGGPRPLGMAGGPDSLIGQDVAGTNDHNAQVAQRVR